MSILTTLFNPILNFLLRYPTPSSLGYLWNFGVSSLFFLVVQIITGIFLSMHYVPNELFAFESVEDIMRNISYGWLFRYMHSNGASFFFICVYAHVFRNIYYLSFFKTTSMGLIHWCCNLNFNDSYCIYRLCFTLRTDELLSCNCNYKFIFCNTLLW